MISGRLFHHLVNPKEDIHPIYGTNVHGYTNDQLKIQPTWDIVGRELFDWMKNSNLEFSLYKQIDFTFYNRKLE